MSKFKRCINKSPWLIGLFSKDNWIEFWENEGKSLMVGTATAAIFVGTVSLILTILIITFNIFSMTLLIAWYSLAGFLGYVFYKVNWAYFDSCSKGED